MRPSAPVRREFDGGVARVKRIYESSTYQSVLNYLLSLLNNTVTRFRTDCENHDQGNVVINVTEIKKV